MVLLVFLVALLLAAIPPRLAVDSNNVWTVDLKRTAMRADLQWDWGHAYSGIEIDKQPLSQLLASALSSYRFTLPLIQLERSISYRGSSTRLRHVVGRMLAGRDVKVGVIGGSISWGDMSSKRGETDWFSVFSKWLIAAFPRSNIVTRNGCVPGVPSSYMILCLEQSVDRDVDLMFVEFTLNDGVDYTIENSITRGMERLVRRLLALPGRPAVVLMHSPSHGLAMYPRGHPKHPEPYEYKYFHQTMEDVEGSIAQYYDVQSLSVRTALYRLAVHKQVDGFLWEQTFNDIHPGDQGHHIMSDMAVHLLQQTAIGLLMRPFARDDEEALIEPIPEAMFPGNNAPDSPMCIMYDDFRPLVIVSEGWEYTVEGTPDKPKPGFIATSPGARMVVRINTDRTNLTGAAPAGPPPRLPVFFHHLKSYEHMGIVEFRCIGGCECEPTQVNGHMERKASQLYIARFEASQLQACDIQITVLDETHSGEHKFKVAGVVIAEQPGRGYMDQAVNNEDGAFGIREHNGDRAQMYWSKNGLVGAIRH